MLTEVKKYLDTVCEQIRFQKAHESIKIELQQHIIDQANAYMEEGMEEQKAFDMAVTEMGDPVLVGTELDRVHRPSIKWSFLFFVVLFWLANLAMRWTIFMAGVEYGVPFHRTLLRNIIAIIVSIAVIVLFYMIDFTVLAKRSRMIYVCYVLLIALLFIAGEQYGIFVNGNIWLFGVAIPPLIYLFPVILIALLYDCRGKSYVAILLCGASFLLPAIFSINMRINTAIFIITMVSFMLILISICKGWFCVSKLKAILMLFAIVALFIFFVYAFMPNFGRRLQSLSMSIKDIYGQDWIRNTLQHNVKGANLFGVGESYSFYTEKGNLFEMTPENFFQGAEYFVNYAVHYFGWIIFILFLSIYFFFIVKGFVLAHRQKSQLGSMTAYAVLLTISIIAVWNIFCVSGFFVSANPLEFPFFAAGGTKNIVYSMLMGILLSVFRTGKYTRDDTINNNESQKNALFSLENTRDEITFCIHIKKRQKKIVQKKGEDLFE